MLEMYAAGFLSILNVNTLLVILMGVVLGIMFGASPGLTTSMGMVFLLPLTFSMSPVNGMALLTALYIGGTSGGLITAILLNIPGTPAAISTTFDGYPMAQRGEAGKALGVGILFSFLGGLFSFSLLFVLAAPLARIAVRFTPFDYFGITFFAVTLIGGLSGKSVVKGIVSALLGMTMASFGSAPLDGYPRFTFGWRQLNAGFHLLPVLIGVYAVTEILKCAEHGDEIGGIEEQSFKIIGFGISMKEFVSQIPNAIRSMLIGLGIGTLPGLGAGQANILAYSEARRRSKHPEKFGTGIIDGVVASETANNAVIGGALIPTLTMGIPGDAGTAMLLAGFMIHGLNPGPMLMQTSSDLVHTIFASLIIANFVMIIVEYFGIRIFIRLLKIPKYYILPVIIVLCMVGAFSINNRIFDAISILIFAGIGYWLYKFEYPVPPFILGFILSPIIEINFRRGLIFSEGSYLAFLQHPVSAFFIILTVVSFMFMVFKRRPGRSGYGKSTGNVKDILAGKDQ
jgi:putative tricarboxylic transport membrane protein